MFLITSSYDFFGVYLAIEGLSLTLYTMAAMLHQGVVATEAAIKYFALGALSTGIMLFGISILYTLVGSLDFLEVQLFFLTNEDILISMFKEAKIALLCIMFGFFFKLGGFPCHVWVADVYEGVWTPVTAFFAIVVKATLILLFYRVFYSVFFSFLFFFQKLFVCVAIGSILIGSLGALRQLRLKRFLAYASISQVGLFFLGAASCSFNSLVVIGLALVVYLLMSIIFFAVLLNTEHVYTKRGLVYLSDLYYMPKYNSQNSKYMTLTLLSMGGLPPLGGFISKLLVYAVALEAHLEEAVFFCMLINVISTYYYLNIVRHIWFEKGEKIRLYFSKTNSILKGILSVCSVGVVGIIIVIPTAISISTELAAQCMLPFMVS